MYNNKQVSKVLVRISAETCLKIDYFDCKSKKSGLRCRPPVYV